MLKLEMHIICYVLCMTIYRCCYTDSVGDAHYCYGLCMTLYRCCYTDSVGDAHYCYGLCMTIYRCCYAEVGDAHYLLWVVYDNI